MDTLHEKTWHEMTPEDVAVLLDTSFDRGLVQAEAEARLRHLGPDSLPGRRQKSALKRLLLQFHQPLVYILLASGAITVLLGEAVAWPSCSPCRCS